MDARRRLGKSNGGKQCDAVLGMAREDDDDDDEEEAGRETRL